MKKTALLLFGLLTAGVALADNHWVGTWGYSPTISGIA